MRRGILLTGLIASVSSNRGSGDDIGLVQSLVTSYIKKPSCIILLTVACESEQCICLLHLAFVLIKLLCRMQLISRTKEHTASLSSMTRMENVQLVSIYL